jgi:hypothetical protein
MSPEVVGTFHQPPSLEMVKPLEVAKFGKKDYVMEANGEMYTKIN